MSGYTIVVEQFGVVNRERDVKLLEICPGAEDVGDGLMVDGGFGGVEVGSGALQVNKAAKEAAFQGGGDVELRALVGEGRGGGEIGIDVEVGAGACVFGDGVGVPKGETMHEAVSAVVVERSRLESTVSAVDLDESVLHDDRR